MGEIKFVVGLTMVALFTLAIVTYAINFGNDNNAPVNLNNESSFVTLQTEIGGNMTAFEETINESNTILQKSDADYQNDVMNSGNMFKQVFFTVPLTLGTMFSTIQNTLFGGSGSPFGVIFLTLSALLLFIGGRYLYKSWFGKDPD